MAEVDSNKMKSLLILERTNDGQDLSLGHLEIIKMAVVGALTLDGQRYFDGLYALVMSRENVPLVRGPCYAQAALITPVLPSHQHVNVFA